MRKLILVKHARPEVVPGVPAERWVLSAAGRDACGPLAEALRPFEPAAVVASVEPKAAETGRLVADGLRVPFETVAGLHEHDRSNVPHVRSRDFISMMELFFRRPDELVLGRETADTAAARFAAAVERAVTDHPTGNLALVSHGTVIALFAAGRRGGGKPFDLWRRMGLPSFVMLNVPGYDVEKVVETVDSAAL
jgi:broad specificity phosphatase PhoE